MRTDRGRSAHAAAAVALVTLALVGPIVIAAPAAAQRCGPAAIVDGPDDASAEVAATLSARGIPATAAEGCRAVNATVARTEQGVSVEVVDASGRRASRAVANVNAAASVVESWARPDLAAPMLAPRPAPEAARAVPADEERPPVVERVVVHHTASGRPLGLGVAAESSLASDGSLWLGLSASACVRLGAACAGVSARAAFDTRATGGSARVQTSREAVDVLVGVALPLRAGTVTITPGVGVGAGWIHSGNVTSGNAAAADNVDIDGGGLRASAHVELSLPISTDLTFDVGFAADVSIFGHAATFVEDGATLAGEPRGFLRVSAGIGYGLR